MKTLLAVAVLGCAIGVPCCFGDDTIQLVLASHTGGTYEYNLVITGDLNLVYKGYSPLIVLSGLSGVTGASAPGSGLGDCFEFSASFTSTTVTVSGRDPGTCFIHPGGGSLTFGPLRITSTVPTAADVQFTVTNLYLNGKEIPVNGTVQGPVDLFAMTLADLSAALASGGINNQGIASALTEKITNAKNASDPITRNNILNAFVNQVNAQTGKHITEGTAAHLLGDAALLSALP